MTNNKLEGKVALVSGSGRGIGREIALKLASEGARVVVNDLDADPAAQTVADITAAGGTAIACAGSVTEAGFAERFVAAGVDTWGGLDIIVNNAGYTWDNVVQKMSDEQWDAMLAVHLTAPFRILRAASGFIREAARREADAEQEVFRKVVNISSTSGVYGNAGQANYAAAKAGINGLTKAMAKEWGRYKVTVNSVAFGLIKTRLTEADASAGATIDVEGRQIRVGVNPQILKNAEAMIPLGRGGYPHEAAGAVYLFCIPESNYVSGQVLVCGGGPPVSVVPLASRAWETEDMRAVRDSARRFFERECVPHEMRWRDQHHADRDIWNKAGAAGLLCASIPDDYGGGGGSFLHEVVICEEQWYAMAQCFSNNVHSGIVAHYLLAYGSEQQKQRWLPKMATGEVVVAIAMSEPGAGTDLQRMRATARRDGDHYVINGSKIFITNGLHADLVCVAVKTDATAGGKGISLLMVETADADGPIPGFKRGALLDKIGQKTLDTVELFFDNVRVPVDNLLGGVEGKGFAQLMQQLPRERLLIAVGSYAMMKRAIVETLDHVRERQVFGASLMQMQNVRFKLAECETQAELARAFIDDCIAKLQAGQLDNTSSAMAKWWVSDASCKVVDECLQFFGGYGYMNEYPIARLYADVRVSRIYGGANEVMKEIIARGLEKR